MSVRTAPGVNGPVILAAWCATCRQESMPMSDGTCGFCDRTIIGADPGLGTVAVRVPRVTEYDIVTALQRTAARLGRTPYANEWNPSGGSPSKSTIYRRFGSWAAALDAAGLA